jgi:hypothetical protein
MSSNATVVVGTPYTRITDANGVHRLAVDSYVAPFTNVNTVNGNVDAFGRLRSSTPAGIFDSKQIYDDQPLLFSTFTANGGTTTYVQAKAATTLNANANPAGRALRQTKRYLNYQPGKSQLSFITFNMNGVVAGVAKSAGLYDDNNGIFFRIKADGTVVMVRRSNVSGVVIDTEVPQASWNVDPMNGTGPSGVTLDLTKVQILVIDYEWLGVGSVRVGFDVGQAICYVHHFEQANIGATVYMQTPNLPVRWEVANSAVPAAATTLDAICCSVQSEGGLNPLAVQRTASRGVSGASANTTLQSMFSIRLKSAYNRATVFPLNGTVVTTDTGVDYYGQLVLNPTFGVPLAGWTGVTNSPVESSNTVTTVSGGTVLGEFYGISASPGASGSALVTTSADLNSVLAIASDYAGTSDILTIAVRTFSGTTASSMYALIDWLELL